MKENNPYLNYLFSLERKPIRLGLRNISILCSLLGNPQLSYKTIHIAGTNGKGSTVAMISSILKEAGFRAGMNTSPHLYDFRERIQVNGKKITEKELIKGIKKVKELIEAHRENNKKFRPSFFEVVTAIAFEYFRKKKVDYAVFEVGMGGRLDATNVINPEVAVITTIGLEHQRHLGNTIQKIAFEKAGIIKENSLVVTAEEKKEVLSVFRKKCSEKKARLFEVKKLCKYKIKKFNLMEQEFSAVIKGKNYPSIRIPLLGEHEAINACTSILAVQLLKEKINEKAIRNGLKEVDWPGRFEVKKKNPLVVFDVTHNPHGANASRKTLIEFRKRFNLRKLIMVIGISKDKNLKEIASILFPLADRVIISKSSHHRAMDTDRIEREARKYMKEVKVIPDVNKAINHALNSASINDFVFVTGSIYLLGETKGKIPKKGI